MGTPFRRPFSGVQGVFGARQSAWNTSKSGGQHLPAAFRLPAVCTVSKGNLSLSNLETEFTRMYPIDQRGPNPRLIKVTIKRTGQEADRLNLALRIEYEFEIFDPGQFNTYAETFLRTDPYTDLNVSFNQLGSQPGRSAGSIKGARVVYGTFNFTKDSSYLCKGVAIGPGEILGDIDMLAVGDFRGLGIGQYINESGFGSSKTQVFSYKELMLYDAQQYGAQPVEDQPDGKVVSVGGGQCIIYKPADGQFNKGGVGRFLSKLIDTDKDAVETDMQEYFTLEYVINRLVKQVSINLTKNKGRNSQVPLSLEFSSEPYSRITPGLGTGIRSCDPFNILILSGAPNGTGNYENGKDGKNWENVVGAAPKAHLGSKIDFRKILLNRYFLNNLFDSAQTEDGTLEASGNVKGDVKKVPLIRIKDFLSQIFLAIKHATGGYVDLGLYLDDEDKKHGKVIIVDLKYTSVAQVKPLVFDPISGDGNTRECIMTANVPSSTLQQVLFSKVNDDCRVPNQIQPGGEPSGGRDYLSVLTDLNRVFKENMPKTKFSEVSVQGATQLMNELRSLEGTAKVKSQNVFLWALEMDVRMDGIWGWRIGNTVSSTALPSFYRQKNSVVFAVTEVVDTFTAPNDWETSIKTMLTVQ